MWLPAAEVRCWRTNEFSSKLSSRSAGSVDHTNPLLAEAFHRKNAKTDEDRQNDALRDRKRWLGLRRRQRFERRHLLEELRDQNEHIKVESHHRADHIGPPPAAGEVPAIACLDRQRQQHQRYGANHVGRLKSL